MNPVRYPFRSAPFPSCAHSNTELNVPFPLCSESRRSIPNSATAAANLKSGEALAKAAMESDGVSVKVQYIGAPRYRLVVKAPDYKTAEEEIQKAAARVIKVVTAKGGEAKFHRKD